MPVRWGVHQIPQLGCTSAEDAGETRFSPDRSTTEAWSAAATHEDCSRFPLKPTSWFQPQTTQEHCQPLSLKSLFRATQKVYPNTSWDDTMQLTQLPTSQPNSPFQIEFKKSNTLCKGTSRYLLASVTTSNTTPAPAATSLQKQLPVLHRRLSSCTSSAPAATSSAPAATSSAPAATSPASATFLQQRLLILHQQLPVLHQRPPSCTSYHFPAPAEPATTSPEPVTINPEPATALLHQRSPSCTSRYQLQPVLHQQLPVLNQRPLSCTNRHQQLSVLNQPPPSCISDHLPAPVDTSSSQFCTTNYQFWTSDHFPAPADTSNYQSWTSDHFPAPADTCNYQFCTTNYQPCTCDHLPAPTDISSKPATIFLHQRKPVLHQRPSIQRILVLYQLSRPAAATRSSLGDCLSYAFPIAIRHNKVWPSKQHPCFCHSCSFLSFLFLSFVFVILVFVILVRFVHFVRCQLFIFQKFARVGIFIWPPQQVWLINTLPNRLRLYNTQTAPLQTPPPSECPRHDTKLSDGEVPVMLELWGMRNTPSLPLLLDPVWTGMVAPDSALSMG